MATESISMVFDEHHTSLSPAEIERALSGMWKTSDGAEEGGAVTRVVLGNVVWIGLTEHLPRIQQVIQKVVPKFPCRMFLLEYQPDNHDPNVDAAVKAQCFVPQKGQPPVCGEVVHLVFGPKSAQHVRGCVTPLLLPDLQTVLWVNLGDGDMSELLSLREYVDWMVSQISLADNPAVLLRRILDAKRPYFDLSWFRLAPIRDQLAAFFDDPRTTFKLSEISRVRVGIVSRRDVRDLPEILGSMFIGWLASRLQWEPKGPQGKAYVYTSPTGPVEAIIETQCEAEEKVLNNMNLIQLWDRAGNVFTMELRQRGGAMNLWCGDHNVPGEQRHVILSELSESDAIGSALNAPTSYKPFLEAARKAVDLMDHHHQTAREA